MGWSVLARVGADRSGSAAVTYVVLLSVLAMALLAGFEEAYWYANRVVSEIGYIVDQLSRQWPV